MTGPEDRVLRQELSWWDFETTPLTGNPDEFGTPALVVDNDVPGIVRAALAAVVEDFDNAICQAVACDQDIGYVLNDADDQHPTQVWHWTTIVLVDGKVGAVCEECSPSNVYDFAPTV